MKQAVLTLLNKCPVCGRLTYNADKFCDIHGPDDLEDTNEKSDSTTPAE